MKLYPEIPLIAKQNNLPVSGFKVWFIAKHYCGGRRGVIPDQNFRKYLKGLGVVRATYSRWIRAAIDLGLFEVVQGKRKKGKYYRLVSWQQGAYNAGCERLARAAEVDIVEFVGRSWLSLCQAAFLQQFGNKPVSRETVTALTGTPRRTQQYREKRARVQQVENVAIYGKAEDIAIKTPERMENLFDGPGVFINKAGDLCRRLPNSKELPDSITVAKKGRTKKVNKALRALFVRGAEAPKTPVLLRYSENPKQSKQLQRKLRKDSVQGHVTIYERFEPGKWLIVEMPERVVSVKIAIQRRQGLCTI